MQTEIKHEHRAGEESRTGTGLQRERKITENTQGLKDGHNDEINLEMF